MSLRWKVVILLSVVSAMFAGTNYVVQRLVVLPGFLEAERAEAEQDLSRCVEAIRREGEHLARFARDYSAWDDTYRYIEDRNEQYGTVNLVPTTFATTRINLLAFARLDGELVWGQVRTSENQELMESPDLFACLRDPNHPLVAHRSPEASASGLLMTEHGPMQVASQPILTSEAKGPVRGAVIMGRFIDEEAVAELANRTRVALNLWPIPGGVILDSDRVAFVHSHLHTNYAGGVIPESDRVALEHVATAESTWIRSDDAGILRGYTVIRDLFDKPVMLLRADLPRTISRRGLAAGQIATGCSIVGGFTILLAMWLMLQRRVIQPLIALTGHVVRVGTECDLRARLNLQRPDEIGVLAREFDRMVASLAEYRAKLLDTARRAGMADVAVEVLHNVGNVLNSVNVSAGLVAEKLRQSEVPSLSQAAKMMLDHEKDLGQFITGDERGRQLPRYLAELARFMADEQDVMLKELKTLGDAVDHIKQIVSTQSTYSNAAPLLESVDPVKLVEEAIRLHFNSFEKHHIQLVRQFEPVDEIEVDKHKVLQILVNLLSNAKNALKDSGRPDRQITLRVERVGGETDRVRIAVRDEGVGIAPENLSRVFGFGFSTCPGGHGYGLHSAINMARELGGTITAESAGPGSGATFTLELPVVCKQVQP